MHPSPARGARTIAPATGLPRAGKRAGIGLALNLPKTPYSSSPQGKPPRPRTGQRQQSPRNRPVLYKNRHLPAIAGDEMKHAGKPAIGRQRQRHPARSHPQNQRNRRPGIEDQRGPDQPSRHSPPRQQGLDNLRLQRFLKCACHKQQGNQQPRCQLQYVIHRQTPRNRPLGQPKCAATLTKATSPCGAGLSRCADLPYRHPPDCCTNRPPGTPTP